MSATSWLVSKYIFLGRDLEDGQLPGRRVGQPSEMQGWASGAFSLFTPSRHERGMDHEGRWVKLRLQ